MANSKATELEEDYHSALKDLTNPSRPLITMLTMLAEESIDNAAGIVRVINEWCLETQHKLCVMFLVDSIMKNVGKNYIRAFSNIIVAMFTHVFKAVDERTRRRLFELRLTWNDVLPSSRLYFLDAKINEMDPAWPLSVTAPEPKNLPVSSGSNIHLNPNKFMVFGTAGDQVVSPTASSDTEALRKLQMERRMLDEEKKKVLMMMKASQKETIPNKSIVPPLPLPPTTSIKQAEHQSHRTKKKIIKGSETDAHLPAEIQQSKKKENVKQNIHVSPTRAKDLIPIITAHQSSKDDVRGSSHSQSGSSKSSDSSPGHSFTSPRDPRLLAKEKKLDDNREKKMDNGRDKKIDDVRHKERGKVVFRELPRSQERRIRDSSSKERSESGRSRSKEKSERSRDPRINKSEERRMSTPKDDHKLVESKISSSDGPKSSVSHRDPRLKGASLKTFDLFKTVDLTEDEPPKVKHKEMKVRYRERHDDRHSIKGGKPADSRDKLIDLENDKGKLKKSVHSRESKVDVKPKGNEIKIEEKVSRHKGITTIKLKEYVVKEKVPKPKVGQSNTSEIVTKAKDSAQKNVEKDLTKERERVLQKVIKEKERTKDVKEKFKEVAAKKSSISASAYLEKKAKLKEEVPEKKVRTERKKHENKSPAKTLTSKPHSMNDLHNKSLTTKTAPNQPATQQIFAAPTTTLEQVSSTQLVQSQTLASKDMTLQTLTVQSLTVKTIPARNTSESIETIPAQLAPASLMHAQHSPEQLASHINPAQTLSALSPHTQNMPTQSTTKHPTIPTQTPATLAPEKLSFEQFSHVKLAPTQSNPTQYKPLNHAAAHEETILENMNESPTQSSPEESMKKLSLSPKISKTKSVSHSPMKTQNYLSFEKQKHSMPIPERKEKVHHTPEKMQISSEKIQLSNEKPKMKTENIQPKIELPKIESKPLVLSSLDVSNMSIVCPKFEGKSIAKINDEHADKINDPFPGPPILNEASVETNDDVAKTTELLNNTKLDVNSSSLVDCKISESAGEGDAIRKENLKGNTSVGIFSANDSKDKSDDKIEVAPAIIKPIEKEKERISIKLSEVQSPSRSECSSDGLTSSSSYTSDSSHSGKRSRKDRDTDSDDSDHYEGNKPQPNSYGFKKAKSQQDVESKVPQTVEDTDLRLLGRPPQQMAEEAKKNEPFGGLFGSQDVDLRQLQARPQIVQPRVLFPPSFPPTLPQSLNSSQSNLFMDQDLRSSLPQPLPRQMEPIPTPTSDPSPRDYDSRVPNAPQNNIVQDIDNRIQTSPIESKPRDVDNRIDKPTSDISQNDMVSNSSIPIPEESPSILNNGLKSQEEISESSQSVKPRATIRMRGDLLMEEIKEPDKPKIIPLPVPFKVRRTQEDIRGTLAGILPFAKEKDSENDEDKESSPIDKRRPSFCSPHSASWEKFRDKNPEFREYRRQASEIKLEPIEEVTERAESASPFRPRETFKEKEKDRQWRNDNDFPEREENIRQSLSVDTEGGEARRRASYQLMVEQLNMELNRGQITPSEYGKFMDNVRLMIEEDKKMRKMIEKDKIQAAKEQVLGSPWDEELTNRPDGGSSRRRFNNRHDERDMHDGRLRPSNRSRFGNRFDGKWSDQGSSRSEEEWTGEPDLKDMPDQIIQKVLKESETRTITIDNHAREIRIYGENALCLMDWDNPRILTFTRQMCSIVFDDRAFILNMEIGEDYKEFYLDNVKHRIKLGVPTQEILLDGKGYQCFFGGKPITVHLSGRDRTIQLEGKLPQVDISKEKNIEYLVGRIELIIHAKKIVPLYLDAKPQKFTIDGKTFILKFIDSLQAVTINGQKFKVNFGGLPISISVRGCRRYLRFSQLPDGIFPGKVSILGMDKDGTDLIPTYLPNPPRYMKPLERPNIPAMFRQSMPNMLGPQNLMPGPVISPFIRGAGPMPNRLRPEIMMNRVPVPMPMPGSNRGPTPIVKPPGQVPNFLAPGLQNKVANLPPSQIPGLGSFSANPFIESNAPSGDVASGSYNTDSSKLPQIATPPNIPFSTTNSSVIPGSYNTSQNLLMPPPQPPQLEQKQMTSTQSGLIIPPVIDVGSLVAKLFKTGIIGGGNKKDREESKDKSRYDRNKRERYFKPVEDDDEEERENDEFEGLPLFEAMFTLDNLRVRNKKLITKLHRGMQCSSCGLRYPPDKTAQYSNHLDWHFRMNKKQQESMKKANMRKFYLCSEDWNRYEEIEDIEERVPSMFEMENMDDNDKAGMDGSSDEEEEIPSVAVSADNPKLGVCQVCHETFDQFFHHNTEEWHYKYAVHVDVDGLNYHKSCHQDMVDAKKAEEERIKKEKEELEAERIKKEAEKKEEEEKRKMEAEKIKQEEEKQKLEAEKLKEEEKKKLESEKLENQTELKETEEEKVVDKVEISKDAETEKAKSEEEILLKQEEKDESMDATENVQEGEVNKTETSVPPQVEKELKIADKIAKTEALEAETVESKDTNEVADKNDSKIELEGTIDHKENLGEVEKELMKEAKEEEIEEIEIVKMEVDEQEMDIPIEEIPIVKKPEAELITIEEEKCDGGENMEMKNKKLDEPIPEKHAFKELSDSTLKSIDLSKVKEEPLGNGLILVPAKPKFTPILADLPLHVVIKEEPKDNSTDETFEVIDDDKEELPSTRIYSLPQTTAATDTASSIDGNTEVVSTLGLQPKTVQKIKISVALTNSINSNHIEKPVAKEKEKEPELPSVNSLFDEFPEDFTPPEVIFDIKKKPSFQGVVFINQSPEHRGMEMSSLCSIM